MAVSFTPFALLTALISIIILLIVRYAVIRRYYWLAGITLGVAVLISVFQPIRLITETVVYNSRMDSRIIQDHAQALNKLPPKIEATEQSYDEYLANQNKLLTKPEEKK